MGIAYCQLPTATDYWLRSTGFLPTAPRDQRLQVTEYYDINRGRYKIRTCDPPDLLVGML